MQDTLKDVDELIKNNNYECVNEKLNNLKYIQEILSENNQNNDIFNLSNIYKSSIESKKNEMK